LIHDRTTYPKFQKRFTIVEEDAFCKSALIFERRAFQGRQTAPKSSKEGNITVRQGAG
jgi:hypothetical protein